MKHSILFTLLAVMPLAAIAVEEAPYAGQQDREIKALSIEEIDAYLSGKGMGFAKAAELNHYPGPRHVIDLAVELELSQGQVRQSRALFEAMQQQAVSLGRDLVKLERRLDQHFADGSINPVMLKALTGEVGHLKARIRFVHLSAHLDQRALLTAGQMERYDRLRGYGASHSGQHAHSH
jgi:hypothetical protein